MDATKAISFSLILLAVFGLYLQSQGKLSAALTAVTTSSTGDPTHESLAKFAIALVVYIAVMSAVSSKVAIGLTAIIALGALLVNHQTKGSDDLITQLTKLGSG